MAGGLGLFGLVAAGGLGKQYILDRREQQRNEILQRGIREAMGHTPTPFDADLFPGEAPIEGLYNDGAGLLGDPNSIENQLQFATDIFDLPGGQEFAGSIFQNALGYAQDRYEQTANLNAAQDQFDTDQARRTQEHREQLQADNFWNYYDLMQDQYEFEQGRRDALDEPESGYQFAIDDAGQRIQVPRQYSETWNKYYTAQTGLEDSIIALDDLMTAFDAVGNEYLPSEAKGKLASLSSVMQLRSAQFLETGALSQDELELIQDVIADPTEVFGKKSNAEIRAGYQTAMNLLQQALRQQNRLTKYWHGLGSTLDQQTPSQARAAANAAAAEQAAQEQGLLNAPPAVVPPQAPPGLRGRGIGARTTGTGGVPQPRPLARR